MSIEGEMSGIQITGIIEDNESVVACAMTTKAGAKEATELVQFGIRIGSDAVLDIMRGDWVRLMLEDLTAHDEWNCNLCGGALWETVGYESVVGGYAHIIKKCKRCGGNGTLEIRKG
jgi:hypothetical protein